MNNEVEYIFDVELSEKQSSHADPKGNLGEKGMFKIPLDTPASKEGGFVNTFTFVIPPPPKSFKMILALIKRYAIQTECILRNTKHLRAVERCLKYNNRIPRKYRRMYGLVIDAAKKKNSSISELIHSILDCENTP